MAGKKGKKGGKGGREGLVAVDPAGVYFTHSRIRPFFSGCGRKIMDTVASIEGGEIGVEDLPTITVIASNADGSPPYFSLNNRRLYTFKALRARGALEGRSPPNTVPARVRPPGDSKRLREKYTIDKCSLSAKFMREGPAAGKAAAAGAAAAASPVVDSADSAGRGGQDGARPREGEGARHEAAARARGGALEEEGVSAGDEDEDGDEDVREPASTAGGFGALLGDSSSESDSASDSTGV